MLYWLSEFAGELSVFNVFRYITFRTGGAVLTALLFVFLFGPKIIRNSRPLVGRFEKQLPEFGALDLLRRLPIAVDAVGEGRK